MTLTTVFISYKVPNYVFHNRWGFVWLHLSRELIWHERNFATWPSIIFCSIMNSRSKQFLKTTGT